MEELSLKTIEKNNIYFHFVPTKKFKTMTFVAKLKAPLDRKDVTKRALLPFVLEKGTETYPSEQALQRRLDELYGAKLFVATTKKGPNHIIHFQLDIANDKFISGANITEEALKLLNEVMFRPHLKDGLFDAQLVEREKRLLENKIHAIYDSKLAYANQRLIDEMFKDEPFSIHKDGYVDDLEEITPSNLTAYYYKVMVEDRIDFYVLGDFTPEEMEEQLTAIFKRKDSKEEAKAFTPTMEKTVREPKRIVEQDAIQQAKLHIGYRTNVSYADETYSALQVFNGLFGAFPNSKLFLNVREKHSLAYYISSQVESHASFLVVLSGVDSTEEKKAFDIIEEQRQSLREGNFTEAEVKNVQDLITNNIRETLDSPSGTIELLYQQIVGGRKRMPDQLIEEVRKVTREEVIEIANKIELDTVYVLVGESNE